MKVKSETEVAQSCPTLRDPTDCSLPGSSVHGIFQARVLKWGANACARKAALSYCPNLNLGMFKYTMLKFKLRQKLNAAFLEQLKTYQSEVYLQKRIYLFLYKFTLADSHSHFNSLSKDFTEIYN